MLPTDLLSLRHWCPPFWVGFNPTPSGVPFQREYFSEVHQAAVTQDDWVVRQREDLRIVSPALWEQVQRRMEGQRAIYMRHTNGHLFSKPSNSLEARYLLSGMALCGVCGGTFTAKLSSHRIAARRHVRYVWHSY